MKTEESLHRAVVDLLRLDATVLWYHPANEGTASASRGTKMKALGVRAGVADIALVLPDGRAAFLELKSPKGRLNVDQMIFQTDCFLAEIPYAIARSLEEARVILTDWKALAGKVTI